MIDREPSEIIGLFALLLMVLAALIGERLRRSYPPSTDDQAVTQEGYIMSGILGLLALLLGFTFSLAVDRFETRRNLVLEEANAIHTAYLRAETFGEPYRTQIDGLILNYLDNQITTGSADQGTDVSGLLKAGHDLRKAMWDASLAAISTQRDDISSAFMDSMNQVMETGSARRAAREAHLPRRVFVVLLFFLVVTALMLGYIMGPRRRRANVLLLVLSSISYALIFDIDSAASGAIREGQRPMIDLKSELST